MTTLNEGRNEIRFNNSGGKCLLENWVEERRVSGLDPANINGDVSSSAKLYKDGHKGVLTTNLDSTTEKITTFRESYKKPTSPGVRERGTKAEALEKMLYEKVSQEVHDEFNPPPEPTEFKSVTHKDFNIDTFESMKPAPTAPHDYKKEQPVTFWTEHANKVHGVSQKVTKDSPFRKNDAFSQPIDEYWNAETPYEIQNYPKM